MDSITSQLGDLTLQRSNVAYLIGRNGNNACYFIPSSDKMLISRCVSIPDTFEVGQLYNFKRSASGSAHFSGLSERDKLSYVDRYALIFYSAGYDTLILPGLLLGSRLRDYDQTCATVMQRASPLILTMPPRPIFLQRASFRAETGDFVDVIVDNVNRESDKSMRLFCDPLKPLPPSIAKGSRLQFCSDNERLPIVTKALELFYLGRPIVNRALLDRIYGKSGSFSYSEVDRRLFKVPMQRGGDVILNAEQSEAVWRYLSPCPAFAVESPPGTGKTMTAAAMAVSYSGPGLQLFLSTANIPVYNLAIAIAGVKYGSRRIIHLISADREAAQSEAERSPFSIFEVEDDEDNANLALFKELGEDFQTASKSKQRRLRLKMRQAHAAALAAADGSYDIILATVDMILCKLLKPKNRKHPCRIQEQLETDVRRVVIDEASQLTEAALNAIVLCFPMAQIVLIGDSKQLPAFKYIQGDVVSEMAARSALQVMKRKKNLPVISMRLTYRQSPSAMRHYSEVFYAGQLQSGKPEQRLLLAPILKTQKDLVFMRVKESKTSFSGTSLINDAEVSALEYLVGKLRLAGYDHNSVMVIAYYEAQRKLAGTRLPADYEILTVDSAQGREKDIIVVLTTRDSPTTTTFFTCPLRCNVAVSRHKRALIILGHETLQQNEPWKQLLQKEHFSMRSY